MTPGDGGFSTSVGVDDDVLDLATGHDCCQCVTEFVDVGVEVGEREEEQPEVRDDPQCNGEEGSSKEEFLVVPEGHAVLL